MFVIVLYLWEKPNGGTMPYFVNTVNSEEHVYYDLRVLQVYL